MGNQQYDEIDGRPFSTDFSFTRFLVPHLNLYEGMALYLDTDMYCYGDITELFDMCRDNYYPVWAVHHKYNVDKGVKMDGQAQEPYNMKNWSSLMMFNCGHHYLENLSIDAINTEKVDGYIHLNGCQMRPQMWDRYLKSGTGLMVIHQKI